MKRKSTIIVSLICMFFPQISFSQNICGKWECPKEMYQYWGYKVGKGHLTFKKDKTFTFKLKGQNFGGRKNRPRRSFYVKLEGVYTERNDSIYFDVRQENIKCHVDIGKVHPAMSPEYDNTLNPTRLRPIVNSKYDDYEYYQNNLMRTWNGREVRYESEQNVCEFQRISMIEQMLDFFENRSYPIKRIDQDSLRLGEKFIITQT